MTEVNWEVSNDPDFWRERTRCALLHLERQKEVNARLLDDLTEVWRENHRLEGMIELGVWNWVKRVLLSQMGRDGSEI